MSTTKQCTKCKTIKNLSEYYKRPSSKDGLNNICKECILLRIKNYRINNLDKLRKQDKRSHNKSRKTNNERSNNYYKENSEKLKKQAKEYRIKNIEDIKRSQHKRYLKNREDLLSKAKAYALLNRDKIKEYKKKYIKTVKGKTVSVNARHKRKSQKIKTADGTIPLRTDNIQSDALCNLLIMQDYKCNVCQCDISHFRHLDHHMPLSKGGTHTISNVVWLCPQCNLTKSNKAPRELLLI